MKLKPRSKSLVRIASLQWWGARAGSVIFMFAALCLYMMSSINPTTMAPVRSATQDIVSPLLTTINKPIVWATDYVGAISGLTAMQEENMVLKAENARLREWYQTAMALQAENEALQGLMNVKLPPRHDYITTRIIADSGNAFAQSLMIQAGEKDGIENGQAVLGENGLVGRVINSGNNSARVLLLHDINSRIPVLILGSNQRAIMAGNNSDSLTLLHLPQNMDIEAGTRVITSGHGGLFPYGLPVGVIEKKNDGTYVVSPYETADRASFIRVVRKPEAVQ